MAGVNKMEERVRAMAAVLLVLTMMAVGGAVEARPGAAQDSKMDSSCATSETYVYPYWSFCNNPAELNVGYTYSAVSIGALFGQTNLEPEYDETNDTYYVRLGNKGATYAAVVLPDSATNSDSLSVNTTIYIINTQSRRALGWRRESTDDYFLVEKETSTITADEDSFNLLIPSAVIVPPLPCPLIYPFPQCQAYIIVSEPSSNTEDLSSGLESYQEGGTTYIKAAPAGSPGDLPLVLTRTTIRSVTAPEK